MLRIFLIVSSEPRGLLNMFTASPPARVSSQKIRTEMISRTRAPCSNLEIISFIIIISTASGRLLRRYGENQLYHNRAKMLTLCRRPIQGATNCQVIRSDCKSMYGALKCAYGSVPLAVLIQRAFPHTQSQTDQC